MSSRKVRRSGMRLTLLPLIVLFCLPACAVFESAKKDPAAAVLEVKKGEKDACDALATAEALGLPPGPERDKADAICRGLGL